MLFFGCNAGEAGLSPSPLAPAASIAPSLSPEATPTPEASPAVSATPFAVNPVYAFYAEFKVDCNAILDEYAAGLSGMQTIDGLSYSLLLTEHRVSLSEGRITIGRLYGSDAEGYSGTLEAAAEGTGSMWGSAAAGYTFTFSYQDGRTLSGSFSGDTLTFTIASAGQPELFCSIQKAEDMWLSTACCTAYQSELTVYLAPEEGMQPVRFGLLTGNYLPTIESTAKSEEE